MGQVRLCFIFLHASKRYIRFVPLHLRTQIFSNFRKLENRYQSACNKNCIQSILTKVIAKINGIPTTNTERLLRSIFVLYWLTQQVDYSSVALFRFIDKFEMLNYTEDK